MKNIHKSTPPSFRRRENAAAIVKAPPPGALTKGPDSKFPGLHPPPGGATSPSLSTNRRFAFPIFALLAALAVGLLFLLPGGPLHAQEAEQYFTYAEKSTGPVATFTASDPEEATPGYWSITGAPVADAAVTDVDIADRALFKIDQNGVLSFEETPSYEDDSASGAGAGSKEYRVTVQLSDGSMVEYFEAYVTVTDVEETGKVTWIVGPDGTADAGTDIRLQQFQPGAQLRPSVTDPDAVTTTVTDGAITSGVTWKWYRGSTVISGDGEIEATYTVVSADVGNHIRVEATYSDGRGPAETVSFTSENPVQAFRRSVDNTAPAFSPTGVTRRVEENSESNVGGPVTATDGNGDKLTYSISGADATFDVDGEEMDRFTIDAATGQVMAAVKLNYETETSYTVMVTATDSHGNTTDPGTAHTPATVTIDVVDVDEKPTFDTGSTAAGVVAAQPEGRTVIDTDADPTDISNDNVSAATLVASDPDGKKVTLSLMGNDAGSFELAPDTDTGNGVNQVLSFKEKPDYEMAGDRNGDNVYEVTVHASDGTMNADRALIIKVINDAGEGGKVTVSPEDAVVGVELTATLAHIEGGVAASGQIANEMWQWEKQVNPGNTACPADNLDWDAIPGKTKAAYTPASSDAGDCLRAMVTYTYQFMTAGEEAMSDGTAVLVSQANQAPKFEEGTRTFRVVAEDIVAAANPDDDAVATDATDDNVGSPITATDANGDDPTYTLGGADASLFRIRSDNGQLEVKGKLDHDTDSSHTVTVTANDGSGTSNATAMITVIIYVTDVDEKPKIKDREDSTAEGMRTVDYPENSTGYVARFTASDPEGAMPVVWSITGAPVEDAAVTDADIADRGLFKIDQNGVLSFKKPRSYEDDSASGDGNAEAKNYQVVVQASDGNENGYFELTVAVTNHEETGKVTWTVTPSGGSPISGLQQFQPGAVLTPTVTDPDDGVTVSEWKWYRESSAISGDGEIEATYTVVADDVGNHIRVDATYTDASSGPAETVSFTWENPVQLFPQPGTNDAPVFSPTAVTRRVEENSEGNVGGPVTATDGNGDKLTYTLGTGGDNTSFEIDPATGQLMVGDETDLDYETKTSYTVQVTATDSSGTPTGTVATVTINVIDVDEKPTFDTGSTAAGVVAAQPEGRTVIDTDADPTDISNDNVSAATLVASDPDGKKVTLSLMGNDAGSFELAPDTDTGNGVNQVLSFKEKPDYEMAGDRNGDNVYEVTVHASDGTMNADRALIIKVINDAGEGGKVTVSPEDAVVGVELTATLAHIEGGVAASGQIANEMWQWEKQVNPGNTACPADNLDWDAIPGKTKAAYTPASSDAGDCLRAMVTYTYQFMTAGEEAMSDGTAVLVSQANQAPKFEEGTRTFRVVAEDIVAAANPDDDAVATDATDDNVGRPITATDANGDDPTYTLGGADASLFRIRSDNGQLEVKGKLDHDTDSSHTVTVTANDGSGTSNATAMITVIIYVTDVDEKPVIMVVPTENQAPMFRTSSTTRSITEGDSLGRAIGSRVTATDLNSGDSLTYTLEGTDAASFSIHSRTGQLRTSDPLDQGTKSTYTVTVRATDSGQIVRHYHGNHNRHRGGGADG